MMNSRLFRNIFCSAVAVAAWGVQAASGEIFAVSGERVDAPLPKGMKLVYMTGSPGGEYLAEYIAEGEQVENWRKRFAGFQRVNDDFVDTVNRTLVGIRQICPDLRESGYIELQVPHLKGRLLLVETLCHFEGNSPYTFEKTVSAFIEGSGGFTHKYWQAWRIDSRGQMEVADQQMHRFISDAAKISLCNPNAGKVCRYTGRHQ